MDRTMLAALPAALLLLLAACGATPSRVDVAPLDAASADVQSLADATPGDLAPSDAQPLADAVPGDLAPSWQRKTSAEQWETIKANARYKVFAGFGAPKNLGPPVNTSGWEDSSNISPDGKTLHFTYLTWDLLASDFQVVNWKLVGNIILSGPPRAYNNYYPHVYESKRRQDGSWGVPTVVDFGGVETWADAAQLSLIGERMYLSIGGPKAIGKADLWYSDRVGDSWGALRSMGQPLNTPYNDENPAITATEDFLFFSSKDRPGGVGGADIWQSKKENGVWQAAVNSGPQINSDSVDVGPFLTWDGQWLYWASFRDGPLGIYRAKRIPNAGWEPAEPVILPEPDSGVTMLNLPTLTADNRFLYFVALFVSPEGENDCDILYVER